MASSTQLSDNDTTVLGVLFDPEASFEVESKPLRSSQSAYDEHIMSEIVRIEHEALASINEIEPAHQKLKSVIATLDMLVEDYSRYASAYSNRAQVRRLLYDPEHLFLDQPDVLDVILSDLSHAISLASPKQEGAVISPNDSSVLSAAHTHRASLFYQASRLERSMTHAGPAKQILGLDAEQLEEGASRDFALGAKHGNKMAKHLAVKTNPYAKMCASIVKQAMSRESVADQGVLRDRVDIMAS